MIRLFLLVPQQVSGVWFEVNITNSDPTVTITWELPSSELPITYYWVAIAENDTNQYSRRVDEDTSLRINVTSGSTYSATVMAVSAVGIGTPSERVTAACEYNISYSMIISIIPHSCSYKYANFHRPDT